MSPKFNKLSQAQQLANGVPGSESDFPLPCKALGNGLCGEWGEIIDGMLNFNILNFNTLKFHCVWLLNTEKTQRRQISASGVNNT